MNITPLNNTKKFNQFLFNEIDMKLYKYKFLRSYIDNAKDGIEPVYDQSVLNISEKGWILILHGSILLVYGENWNENQVHEINSVFNLNKFTNYALSGDLELIEKIIEIYKPYNTQVEKSRILYKSKEIQIFKAENNNIRIGTFDESYELALMLQEYYHEEYKGLNDKPIEEMQRRTLLMIHDKKIYILLDKDENLLIFCTIIDPDIGILFTKREHRNKGYGKIILSYCAQILKERNDTVYLMTDKNEISSNRVCLTVGFEPYYNYAMVNINVGQ